MSEWLQKKGVGTARRPQPAPVSVPGRKVPVAGPERDWGWQPAMDIETLAGRVQQWFDMRMREATVLWAGDPKAEMLCVGQAPAEEECRTGRPFAGRSGTVLSDGLEVVGRALRPGGDVFATNASLWRCPIGTQPGGEELRGARPWLIAAIGAIRPKVIVALGAVAAEALVQGGGSVSGLRGSWHRLAADLAGSFGPNDCPQVRVTWHPAHVSRERTQHRSRDGYTPKGRALIDDLSATCRRLEEG